MIQSSSPRISDTSFWGSVRRTSATLGSVPDLESFVLGRGGSTSRITRSISRNPAACSSWRENGTLPVKSS